MDEFKVSRKYFGVGWRIFKEEIFGEFSSVELTKFFSILIFLIADNFVSNFLVFIENFF